MDFMKVFDQTVREIKREVNLKVLKVPEIEQKVLDATDDEPWGPHGTVLAEIADATKKFIECQMVMNVLWTRLSESDQNWRYVYKALTVIEYLVANGSERALDDIIEHSFQISSLLSFEYVEPSGKDMGINVRKKVENIVALLNNEDKIQEVRKKAAANRDKYFGVSSTGTTYKSGAACSSSFQSSGRYGGFGSDSFKDSYRDKDRFGADNFGQNTSGRSSRGVITEKRRNSVKKGSRHNGSKGQNTVMSGVSKPATKRNDFDKCTSLPPKSSGARSNNYEDDYDDFDPRGIFGAKSAVGSANQIDLFGQSWIGDFMEAPTTVPRATIQNNSSEVDLFANSAFVSASPHDAGGRLGIQTTVDLFASQPASSSAVSAPINLFAAPNPIVKPEKKSPNRELMNTNYVRPSAAVPLNSLGGPDFFAAFTSHADDSLPRKPAQSPDSSHNNLNANSSSVSRPPPKKDSFGVKSNIWADSLSRGLIDLNISASKDASLADIGIISGLSDGSDGKEKGPSTSFYTGAAMGAGSGLGRSTSATTIAGEDFFSNFGNQQYKFGGFQK